MQLSTTESLPNVAVQSLPQPPLFARRPSQWARFAVTVACSVLFAACGGGRGGGGGGGGVPQLPDRILYVSANHETSPGQYAGGIYVYRLDSASGTITMIDGSPFATEGFGGSFVLSGNAKFLYFTDPNAGAATDELFGYRIQTDGSLVSVSGSPFVTTGLISTIVANPAADFLYVAFYSGTVNVYAIDPSTGALSVQPATSPPFPIGPAMLLITPDGKYAYSFVGSGQQNTFEYSIDGVTGALTPLPGSPITLNFALNQFIAAGATVDPSGKFIYITNETVITGFGGPAYGLAIDQGSGAVSIVWSGNPTPGPQSSVTVDSSGKYVAMSTVPTSQTARNCFAVLAIDSTTGALQQVSGSPFPGSPGNNGYDCGVLLADPSEPYIYEGTDTGIFVYSLDLTSGVPRQVATAALPGSTTALAVTH